MPSTPQRHRGSAVSTSSEESLTVDDTIRDHRNKEAENIDIQIPDSPRSTYNLQNPFLQAFVSEAETIVTPSFGPQVPLNFGHTPEIPREGPYFKKLGTFTYFPKSITLLPNQSGQLAEAQEISPLSAATDRYRHQFDLTPVDLSSASTEGTRRNTPIDMVNIAVPEYWGTPKEDAKRFLRTIDLNFIAQTQFVGKDLDVAKCLVLGDKCKGVAGGSSEGFLSREMRCLEGGVHGTLPTTSPNGLHARGSQSSL